MMLCGVIAAGLTYREMRTQRLLHEPVRLFKIDLSQQSAWQSAPLPLYQNGQHIIFLSASAPVTPSPSLQSQGRSVEAFSGRLEVVVEDASGKMASQAMTHPTKAGWKKQDGLVWFECDTLNVSEITSSDWRISMRVVEADPHFERKLAELILIPPHPEEFTPYLERESYKLFASGLLLVCGFLVFIFGGRFFSGSK